MLKYELSKMLGDISDVASNILEGWIAGWICDFKIPNQILRNWKKLSLIRANNSIVKSKYIKMCTVLPSNRYKKSKG